MITAPYSFIPLNKKIYIPSWSEQISQDIPFSDSESGFIRISFTNTTPILISDGGRPIACSTPDGNRRFLIPASSLKGMIRNVMEIMTFSRFDEDSYNENHFGYRDLKKESTNYDTYKKIMQNNVKCGWLRYNKDNDKYILYPCVDFDTIDIENLNDYNYIASGNAIEKFERLGCTYPEINGKKLVCTGHMDGKKHEYLFGEKTGETKIINEEVARIFESINQTSTYFDSERRNSYKYRLDRDNEVPVFFIEDQKGNVTRFGFARMFRIAYKHSVSDGIKQEDRQGKDLCQCIFGYTSKEKSVKGRIQFSHAFSNYIPTDNELNSVRGVLGTPRASFYPFYLNQTNGQLKDYNYDAIEIAGRKRYPIHSDTYITELPTGNNNEKVITEMYMLPANNMFTTEIAIHNLRKIEIGALLSALTFHNTPNTFHNIGMAKGYGYGKLRITNIELIGLSLETKEEYMRLFEKEMNIFLESDWVNSIQVSMLVGMAKEHSTGLNMMELKEYNESKKVRIFNKLSEHRANVMSLISDEERLSLILSYELDKAIQFLKQDEFEKVLAITDKLNILKLSDEQKKLIDDLISEVETRKNEISGLIFLDRINEAKQFLEKNDQLNFNLKITELRLLELNEEQKDLVENLVKEATQKSTEQKIQQGLTFLAEKYPDGQRFKVNDIKGLINRLDQFSKKRGPYILNDNDISILKENSDRIIKQTKRINPKEIDKLKQIVHTLTGDNSWIEQLL